MLSILQPTTQPTFTKKMKEYLVRLIYCEMLGHDASFGYIKARAAAAAARHAGLSVLTRLHTHTCVSVPPAHTSSNLI